MSSINGFPKTSLKKGAASVADHDQDGSGEDLDEFPTVSSIQNQRDRAVRHYHRRRSDYTPYQPSTNTPSIVRSSQPDNMESEDIQESAAWPS
ncbi:hypothetical protein ACJZ2D_004539 [Fusarium nematophilum]